MAGTSIGSTIGRRYTINEKLGEGGMSVVWLARDKRLQRLQAIKEMKYDASNATHRIDVDLMRKEAYMMRELDHPNIVRVNDIIDENESLYVVMDYVPGKDLSKVMRDNRKARQADVFAFPEEDVIDWGIQLCQALGYLHQQNPPIIYRDMKPGNIMLQDDGTIKIIDFGIAREFKPNQQLDTTPLGTRGYASPEAVEKSSQTDARSDVYSLGVTLFHLVTGHSPLEYVTMPNLPPIRSINPELSPALESIIIKSNQWDPGLRQQNMAELQYELQEMPTPATWTWMKRTFRTFRNLCVAAGVCVALGGGSLLASLLVRNSSFAGLLEQGAHASTEERGNEMSQAEEFYTQAIQLNPRDIRPYSALLNDVYIEDDVFSRSEQARWKMLFDKNQNAIRGTSEYAQLCYCAGLDYMVYLETSDYDKKPKGSKDWNDNQDELERGRRSSEWFKEAIVTWDELDDLTPADISLRDTANSYLLIGDFPAIVGRGSESDDRGSLASGDGENLTQHELWREYFNALNDTVLEAPTMDTKSLVKLRLYYTAARAVAGTDYVSSFKNAQPKISRDELTSLVETVRSYTVAMEPDLNNDVLTSLYENTLEACDQAKRSINTVYEAGDRLENLAQGTSGSTTSREGAES